MQNQIVNCAARSFGHFFPTGISRGVKNLHNNISNAFIRRTYSEGRSETVLLPGGGLGKLQGCFKEERYFNTNDHALVAKLQQSNYRLKCESAVSNWSEYERMANACSDIIISSLNKYKTPTEETFFLDEQKILLERNFEISKSQDDSTQLKYIQQENLEPEEDEVD